MSDRQSDIRELLTELEVNMHQLMETLFSVNEEAEDLRKKKPTLRDLLPLMLLVLEGDATYVDLADKLASLTGETFDTCYTFMRAIDAQRMNAGIAIVNRFGKPIGVCS